MNKHSDFLYICIMWKKHARNAHITAISLFLIILTFGCADPQSRSQSATEGLPLMPLYAHPYAPPSEQVLPKDEPYYITGLRLNQEIGLPTELGGIYWILPAHPISATMFFTNGTPWIRELSVICLIDYEQVPCLPQAKVLSMRVQSGAQYNIQLQLAGLVPGMHVITAMALSYVPISKQVINTPASISELVNRSSDFFWYSQLTVNAGSYDIPLIKYTQYQIGLPSQTSNGPLSMGVTTISDTTVPLFLHPNLSLHGASTGNILHALPGQLIKFYLISKHGDDASYYQLARQFGFESDATDLPVMATAFIDTQQIPLNEALPNGPFFSKIPRGKESVIPISFKAPTKPGVYSYFVLYQEGPFVKRGNLLLQDDGGIIYQPFPDILFLNTTDRVIFEVTPEESSNPT